METLKAQYQAFDNFGVQYYEIKKKREGDHWDEWLGTASEVWLELYHSYHIEKSFAGLKASPVLDLSDVNVRKRHRGSMPQQTEPRRRRQRRRESSDELINVDKESESEDAEDGGVCRSHNLDYCSPQSPQSPVASFDTGYEEALHYLVA
jgi:hypothetical protein